MGCMDSTSSCSTCLMAHSCCSSRGVALVKNPRTCAGVCWFGARCTAGVTACWGAPGLLMSRRRGTWAPCRAARFALNARTLCLGADECHKPTHHDHSPISAPDVVHKQSHGQKCGNTTAGRLHCFAKTTVLACRHALSSTMHVAANI